MTFSLLRHALTALILGTLAACSTPPPPPVLPPYTSKPAAPPAPEVTRIPPVTGQPVSRWVAAQWEDLPGFSNDSLHEAWNAWVRSCERPHAAFARLCPEVRRLSIGTAPHSAWMLKACSPTASKRPAAAPTACWTGYYEPQLKATRQQRAGYNVPLYRAPSGLAPRQPWFTRQEIETLPQAQAALQGRAIAWLADPVDAMVLHIQGSGRLEHHRARRQRETGARGLCRHQRAALQKHWPLAAGPKLGARRQCGAGPASARGLPATPSASTSC